MLLIDGTRVGDETCLIARSPKFIESHCFAPYESSTYWDTLLRTIPPPSVVVCDGQKGMLLSIAHCWPLTRTQRCLVHVGRNLRTKLTMHPQSDAGVDLKEHFDCIWDVATEFQAQRWSEVFFEMTEYHNIFLGEKSYSSPIDDQAHRGDDTLKPEPTLSFRPRKRSWWYTHKNVRGAYKQITKLLKDDQLFVFLDSRLLSDIQARDNTAVIPRTTNHLEGGTNSPLKGLLYLHRGMPKKHQKRLAEWYLYGKSEYQKPPRFCL